jgi:hypothetical protein
MSELVTTCAELLKPPSADIFGQVTFKRIRDHLVEYLRDETPGPPTAGDEKVGDRRAAADADNAESAESPRRTCDATGVPADKPTHNSCFCARLEFATQSSKSRIILLHSNKQTDLLSERN